MKFRDQLIGIFSVCFIPGHVVYKEEISLLEEVANDLTLARILKLAANPLAESEDRFSSALFSVKSGASDWNLKSGVLQLSDSMISIFGFGKTDKEFTRETILERVHNEDSDKVARSIALCLNDKKEYDIEYRLKMPDGSIRWIREAGDILLDRNDNPARMLAVVTDISKRKILENELHKALDKAHGRKKRTRIA